MSESIELKINLPLSPAPTEPSAPGEILPLLPDLPTFGGGENGAVYFELNWQTGQAQNLQQNLMANYADDGTAQANFNGGAHADVFAADADSNDNSFSINYRQNLNGQSTNETNVQSNSTAFDLNESIHEQAHLNVASDELPTQETPQNLPSAGHENQPPEMPETLPDESFSEAFSHFENASAEPRTSSVPPNQTAHLPLQNAESFPPQTPNENTFDVPFVIIEHTSPLETPPNANLEFAVVNESFDAPPTQNGEPKTFGKGAEIIAGKEMLSPAPETIVKAENNLPLPINKNSLPTDKYTAAELKNFDHPISNLANLSPTYAKGNAAMHAAAAENSSAHNSTAAQRENGALLGGALINGKLAISENCDENDIGQIKNSPYGGAAGDFETGGTAAGATGTLLSAAIGGLALHAETAFGGVLGSVSGLLTGIESGQGILWLGAQPALSGAAETPRGLTENPVSANLDLSLQFV